MGLQHILPLELLLPFGKFAVLLVSGALLMMALGLRLRQTMIVPPGFPTPAPPEILKRRPAREDEIIAEFLNNEFYHPDFDEVRNEFAAIVLNPNLQDEG